MEDGGTNGIYLFKQHLKLQKKRNLELKKKCMTIISFIKIIPNNFYFIGLSSAYDT